MIEVYFLSNTLVTCPNEVCDYTAKLSEFEQDFDEEDEDITEDFDVPCVCPRCNQKFTAHCEPYVKYTYFVTEEIEE